VRLLDLYIIKRLISTFFFVVLILLAVVSVIDLTDKMDKYAKAELSAVQILGYYADYMAWIGGLLTPITIFIATVYVCSRMAAHTEVIAILSSGISFQRMLLPYFEGAFIIAAISFALNGWIIPNSNKTRIEFELQYLKNRPYLDRQNVHMQVAPNAYLYMQSYQNQSKTGFQFTMERFENNRLIEKLSAANIAWDSVKQKWVLRDWELRKVNQIFEKARGTISDTVETITKGTELDTTLIIHPDEFESDYRMYDGLTMGELNEQIKSLRDRGAAGVEPYQVEKLTRYASPFTIFILVFMGVIVSSRKSRGGTGVQIAVGFVLSFIFIIFFMLFRTYAETGYTWYVWIPNLIFAAIAMGMYKYVPR
jgi:lipopolysaccharide export system permease protein